MTEPQDRPRVIPDAARRDTGLFLGTLSVTVVLYLLGAPWAFAMVVTGPLGALFGVLALIRSWREPGLVGYRVWVGGGIMISLFSTVMGVTFMLFADVLAEYSDCRERAVTHQAQAACDADYQEGVQTTLEDLFARLGFDVTV